MQIVDMHLVFNGAKPYRIGRSPDKSTLHSRASQPHAVTPGIVIAAGSLLVTEAGGIVGEFSGESEYLNKGDIIAAGPKVFAGMVALLKPFA